MLFYLKRGACWLRLHLALSILCVMVSITSSLAFHMDTAAGKPIEVVFGGAWQRGIYTEAYHSTEQELIDRFNAMHKDRIKVIPEPLLGESKLIVSVAAGKPPDIVRIDRFRTGSYASSGLLQPLDELVKRDKVNLEDFFPPLIKEVIYGGRLYALPSNTDIRALFYNKSMFEEVGLDPSRPPRTWEDIEVYQRKIDILHPNGKWERVGFAAHLGNWFFPGWLWAAGGELLDESLRKVTWNSKPGLDALEWMQRSVHHYRGYNIQYTTTFPYPSSRGAEAFMGGSLAMIVLESVQVTNIKASPVGVDLDVAPVPRPKGLEDQPVSWSGGFALAIPVGVPTERRDAAWEFIKFYVEEWAKACVTGKVNHLPVIRNVVPSKEFLADRISAKLYGLLPYTRTRPVVPCPAELWNIYYEKINTLLAEDKLSARQILEQTAQSAQIVLDKAYKEAKVK